MPPDPRSTRLKRRAGRYLMCSECFVAAPVLLVFFIDARRDGNYTVGATIMLLLPCAFVAALAAFDAWSRAGKQRPEDQAPRGFSVLPPPLDAARTGRMV